MLTAPPIFTRTQVPLRAGTALDPKTFATIRRRALLECCKWDAQIGDVCTLASFPVVISRSAWDQLASWAEGLTAEALAAEQAILAQPELLKGLGLPKSIRRLFESGQPLTPGAARVMRFDFHLTTEGWRISEVNSDVPGGFSEGSSFTQMVSEHYPQFTVPGNPITSWSDAIAHAAGGDGVVALLSAAGFMEDHQIISYLAQHLRARGCRVHLAGPEHIQWRDGRAHLESAWWQGELNAIVRFYQGEWLSQLPTRLGWTHFFCKGLTPVGNPGIAALSETKRFPLIWNALPSRLALWRSLLPETRDPREAPWETDDTWLVKSALCNTGDTVSIRSRLEPKKWREVVREVKRRPEEWIAQKRFEPVFFESPIGPMHACVGVYTVNGAAAGAYTRITNRALVDYAAIDAALLVEEAE